MFQHKLFIIIKEIVLEQLKQHCKTRETEQLRDLKSQN